MTIDELTTENKVYRELIIKLKGFIRECDASIYHNEIAIGKQLDAMEKTSEAEDCTLCLGECDTEVDGNRISREDF